MAVGVAMLVGTWLAGCASTRSAGTSGSGRFEPLPAGGYERVVQRTSGPILLLFRSSDCPYCVATESALSKGIANGKPWVVYSVDIYQEPALRQRLGVGPVPCLVYFRDGQEVERSTGWRPAFTLRGKLDRFFR